MPICEKYEYFFNGKLFTIFWGSPKRKTFKMTFSPKKCQGSLQIGITYDLFFVKLKSGQHFFKKIIFLKL